MIVLLIYVAIFVASFFLVKLLVHKTTRDFTARKTVTFGDESAVRPNRIASVISVLTIFLLWGAFTGSSWVPGFLHAPGPFVGDATFTYTAEAEGAAPDDATVTVRVFPVGEDVEAPEVDPGAGWAKDDSDSVGAWRSGLIRVDRNDGYGRDEGHTVVAVNGEPIAPGGEVITEFGRVGMSPKGTLNFEPRKGWQMEPIWLPPPEAVLARLKEIAQDGYRDSTLWEHLGWSLFRVIAGFFFGALIGIPLGYAMGLSDWFRGWFDPIVEFMRPVPPLALIPLVIIWAGIGETGKIILLFLAALWIMAIAARSGVSGVKISKVHAAYSLGASKAQIMRHVIVPNSLPEIFTGARVAMGVCWGTVVAAELVAAEKGAGMMIMVASKFQLTDIVIMGIILIGVIGFGIDILMRFAEKALVPWKGRG
ncbi:ABC transporter permease [Salipiger bermudensis]|uniref:Taurine ABC transporter, permease protein n=1 Tax=Salipiger bermudensis (strain DSM 26914 / JCM 13377 / KCTC 12554 / HTCC2601) TaxID=314265 RepID=Q0FL22_SALBH|nr:ABC transporter permease subunit [Salipiger bermudensis]EAU44838.1 taurine ABC transporter, permease protein [Salipiger bermudensis HTCC2601]MBN9676596.1 ABC transporter permease subunit [Salipiger bermudensis]MBR9891051.1 ABC transporter permease subunit [bacterium]